MLRFLLNKKEKYPFPEIRSYELNIFISSTFVDMQKERDILTRIVIPKLRKSFSEKNIIIREVDLRWGITESMNLDEGAVQICLDEVERCSPLIFCIVGHRVGWEPSLNWLDSKKKKSLVDKGTGTGLTEMEISYANILSEKNNTQKPLVIFRDKVLSEKTGYYDSSDKCKEFRKRISLIEQFSTYDSYQDFERKAEAIIYKSVSKEIIKPSTTEILNSPIINNLKSIKKNKPILIFYKEKSGISWNLKKYYRKGGADIFLDGKEASFKNILIQLANIDQHIDKINENDLHLALEKTNIKHTIIIDHYEDMFSTHTSASLSNLPSKNINKTNIIITTKESHLKDQALMLNWHVIEHKESTVLENTNFAKDYLFKYGKTLTHQQVTILENAKWIKSIGTLVISLDELRRYGNIENLTDRLKQLSEYDSYFKLFINISDNIRSTIPENKQDNFDMIFIALSVTKGGLDESEIINCIRDNNTPLHELNSLWSLFRISFNSIINNDNGRQYISNEEIIRKIDKIIPNYNEKLIFVSKKISEYLRANSEERWYQEIFQITFLLEGTDGIHKKLLNPEITIQSADQNILEIQKWFSKISSFQKNHVVESWLLCNHLSNDNYWILSQIVLNNVPVELYLKLINKDTSKQRKSLRNITIAELTGNKNYVEKIKKKLCEKPNKNSDLEENLFIINSFLNGVINIDKNQIENIFLRTENIINSTKSNNLKTQFFLSLGNLKLFQSDWKGAVAIFKKSVSLARKTGNTKNLCTALERLTISLVETNKFKYAKGTIIECQNISQQFNYIDSELNSFEILITILVSLGEWSEAYSITEEFNHRCKYLINDTSRAVEALEYINNRTTL